MVGLSSLGKCIKAKSSCIHHHILRGFQIMASDLFANKSNKQEEEEEKEKIRDEIISGLPKAKGWITPNVYQYQGFWYSDMILKGIMLVQEHFKARSTDILLATNPKCGTTWLKALAFAILNRTNVPKSMSGSEPEPEPHPLVTTNPHARILPLEIGIFLNKKEWLAEIENQPSPRLQATHIPYTSLPESVLSSGCRVVYITRNPQDMLVSFWHFMCQFKDTKIPLISMQEVFDSVCRGDSLFGPYWDHVLGYYKASLKWPERFLFLAYESMHADTYNHVKRLADFTGYPFSVEEEANGVIQDIIQQCSFETMSNFASNTSSDVFFRKGRIGDSKNYLTPQMMERLDRIIEDKFQGSGLSLYKLQ